MNSDTPRCSRKVEDRKPGWLRIKLPNTAEYAYIKKHLSDNGLNTICESGRCPNIGECWSARTATFMILGNVCSRNCKFCNVSSGKPLPPDADEPEKLASVIQKIGLRHCVITSVTRDDLPDQGAGHWAAAVREIRKYNPTTTIETLIPDFGGNKKLLRIVLDAKPEIVAHNLETTRRLTPLIRSKATYEISLKVIADISGCGIPAKSGIMLGLGESVQEIYETITDLAAAGCSIITIGQYLQPSRELEPVKKYYTPEEFDEFGRYALSLRFAHAESGPLVRSSYHAGRHAEAGTTEN